MDNFIQTSVRIKNGNVIKDGIEVHSSNEAGLSDFLKSIYKAENIDYPKFYKMDTLCKLSFITSEILFKDQKISPAEFEKMGVFISNSTSSLDTDLEHQKSISEKDNYVPSPSVFVYTLPNILMGEICIRNKIKGENTFLIFDKFDSEFITTYTNLLLNKYGLNQLILGWVDCLNEEYDSFMVLINKYHYDKGEKDAFSVENINQLYLNY